MILELDVGNSRLKWRLLQTDTHQVDASGSVADLEELIARIEQIASVSRVRVSCVRKGGYPLQLQQACKQFLGLEAELAQVVRSFRGLQVNYSELSKLGVDRWLAMLAAYNSSGSPCLVIDCGTAMTIDKIDSAGLHLGGFILPGLKLLGKSLTDNTGITLPQAKASYSLKPGNSTEEAVYNGAMAVLVALIEKTIDQLAEENSPAESPMVYFTGGDAALICSFIDLSEVRYNIVPDLVFNGLALALQ